MGTDESIESRVKHLRAVEGLSIRQIVQALRISKKRVARIIKADNIKRPPAPPSKLAPFERLIEQWYREHPYLLASQVYDRLRTYGYEGCYPMVVVHTRRYRHLPKKPVVYHELEFLPGEEAQVDWMQWRLADGAWAYGFVFIMAFSRYLYVRFYPRSSMEFFLEGHINAFKELGGVPRRCRYDNLSSVVLKRAPELKLNSHFTDFSRHYGFSFSLCTPGRANEKGRVERVIRDIRVALNGSTAADLQDLNKEIAAWRAWRNRKEHRSTGKPPTELLTVEKLIALPSLHYRACRSVVVQVGKTGFVEFETNRYSVPNLGAGSCELMAYPDHIELYYRGTKIAVHKRVFLRNQKVENPLHRQVILERSPQYKHRRIHQLMSGMDISVRQFLAAAEHDGQDPVALAYELFRLLKRVSREMLLSALREANTKKHCRVQYLLQLLHVPAHPTRDNPVYPQNQHLLDITYEGRDLSSYDQLI